MTSPLVKMTQNDLRECSPKVEKLCKVAPKTSLTREELIDTTGDLLQEMIDSAFKNYTDVNEIPVKSKFHAQKLPSISIKDYLKRFAKFSNCHEDVFVYLMIYLDKIGENVPDFELDSFNALRVVLMSMVMAVKFYDDYYYRNEYYAKIGGVPLTEFNELEREYLLNYIDFGLYVNVESYAEYYEDLIKYHQDKSSEKESC